MKGYRLFFFLLLSLILFSSITSASLETGLISAWNLDETSGTTANDNFSTNDLTATNGAWVAGLIGNARDNGNTGTAVTNRLQGSVTANTIRSISFWIKPSHSLNQQGYILKLGGLATNAEMYFDSNSRLNYLSRGQTLSTARNIRSQALNTTLNLNEWHHVVVSLDSSDGTNSLMYVNGVEVTYNLHDIPASDYGLMYSNNADFRLMNYFNNNIAFRGHIDAVQIWDRTLTSAEITELYNSGAGKQHPFTGGFTHNITNAYLSPNGTVYTTETDLRGYVTLNDTNSVNIFYNYKINGTGVANGTYTGSPSGNTYTLPVLSNTLFKQTDNVTFSAYAVNSSNTSQVLSSEVSSSGVIITNRLPVITSLSWNSITPLNESNILGYVTFTESDLDQVNISYQVFKNDASFSSGTVNNQNAGTINLFTINSSDTEVDDVFRFNLSLFDGYGYVVSGNSVNSTVVAVSNFTVSASDSWTSTPLDNVTITVHTPYIKNQVMKTRVVFGFSTITVSLFNYELNTYVTISSGNIIGSEYYVISNGTNVSAYEVTDVTPPGYLGSIYDYEYNSTNYEELNIILTTGNIITTIIPNINNYSAFFNSTIITPIISNGTANINVSRNNYFPVTYNNWFLNTTLQAQLYQSVATFTARELITNNLLTGVTYTIGSTTASVFNLSANTHVVTTNKTGYYPKSLSFNTTALSNQSYEVSGLYNQLISLTAKHALDNATINTFNATIRYATYEATYSTTNGTIVIPALQGFPYTITYSTSGTYASRSYTVTTTSTSTYNLEATLYSFNSLLINFKDSETGNLINNVSLEYFSDLDSNVTNTTTGTVYLELLNPVPYIFKTVSEGYSDNYFFIAVSNDSYDEFTIYLNTNTTGTVQVVVIDGSGSEVEGAEVRVLKYFLDTNTYELVSSGLTDPSGLTSVQANKNNGFYKFQVLTDGVLRKTTDPFIINGDIVSIQIFIIDDYLALWNQLKDITSFLTFNELTNNYRLEFSSTSPRTVCLSTYEELGLNKVLLDNTCTTGTTGTILFEVVNYSGARYEAIASTTINSENFVLGKLSKSFTDYSLGSFAIIFQIVLTVLFAFVGLSVGASLLFITIPLSIAIGGFIGLHTIGFGFTAPLIVLGIMLMYLTRDR